MLKGKIALEDDFVITTYYQNGIVEFIRINHVIEKSALREDRVKRGPPL